MKITKTELKKIIKEALLQEMTPAPGGSRFRDPRLSSGDPAKQEYDALTTMISRLDGMEAFLLNTTRQKSDEALTQQAAEQLNALHATLSQLRKGIK